MTVGNEVVLFADTFNRYFERENIDAALTVLTRGRLSGQCREAERRRPTACAAAGRSFRLAKSTKRGRKRSARSLRSRLTWNADVPVIGLEPSCLFSFRDEIPALVKSDTARRVAENALLFEEFLAREAAAGKLDLEARADKKARACCTAIAIRNPSIRCRRSKRR